MGGFVNSEELLDHIFEAVQTASLCLHTIGEGGADTVSLETSLVALHNEALDAFFKGDRGTLRALHRELGGLTRGLLERAYGRKTVAVIL